MKKAARISGAVTVSIVAAIYIFIFTSSIIDGDMPILDWESIGMITLSFMTIVSAVLSWVNLPVGARLTLVVSVLFSVFAAFSAGHNHLFAILVARGPLLIAAVLMLLGLRETGLSLLPG